MELGIISSISAAFDSNFTTEDKLVNVKGDWWKLVFPHRVSEHLYPLSHYIPKAKPLFSLSFVSISIILFLSLPFQIQLSCNLTFFPLFLYLFLPFLVHSLAVNFVFSLVLQSQSIAVLLGSIWY